MFMTVSGLDNVHCRYGSYHHEKYDRNRERYGNNSQYNVPSEDNNRRQQGLDEYKRYYCNSTCDCPFCQFISCHLPLTIIFYLH
jgi:hypothetical protein